MKSSTCLTLFTLLYGLLYAFVAATANDYGVWLAEILPATLILALIWLTKSRFPLSVTAYGLMFIWFTLHTIGAKYSFAEVPFDWFNHLIGSERNQFDRVAHFSIGLYAYPIAEILLRHKKLSLPIATSYALFAIMSIAASYEIIEWWYAVHVGGSQGIAFLGSQGDVWDAQKDMLCDTLGALCALGLLILQTRGRFANPSKIG